MSDTEVNRVALVTGATRGIGKAIAHELATAGHKVIGTATSDAGAAAIAENLRAVGGTGIRLDVSDVEAVRESVAAIVSEHGAPTILVNNAGITRDNLMMRMKDMATLGDCVCLRPKKHALELTVDADLGTATVLVKTTTQMEPWDTGMRFALRYLVSILKVSKLFETASVILQPEMPLGLKMKNTHVSLGFYLAPKFNDDEED